MKGLALLKQGLFAQAARTLRKSLASSPRNAAVLSNVAYCYLRMGLQRKAIRYFKKSLRCDPSSSKIYSNLLQSLHYDTGVTRQELFEFHRRWTKLLNRRDLETPRLRSRKHGRLRLGYVSADFRNHSVAFFIRETIRHHDRSRFEVFCYSNAERQDAETARFMLSADQWREIASLSDTQAASLVRRDKIDVLVDLSGHTAKNRLTLFARKPAPVQITYLGYPDTTGLSAIGFRICDEWTDPAGKSERFATEELVRLPSGFSCYTPPARTPAISGLPADRNGHVTFGSFNNLAKINTTVIRAWAAILKQVPQSRLRLKSISAMDEETRDALFERFIRHGVERDRLAILPPARSAFQHLAQYNEVDIALDTFPYNGHTTTCEALWMGVPVISKVGSSHVSRVGYSLLSRLGLEKLVAANGESYEAKAASLAKDRPALRLLRQDLRSRMRRSNVMNRDLHTKELERLYLDCVSRRS